MYQVSFVKAGGSELGQVGETPKSNHEGCSISLEKSTHSTATAWKPELDHSWGASPRKRTEKAHGILRAVSLCIQTTMEMNMEYTCANWGALTLVSF